MQKLNDIFDNKLALAIEIFKGSYPKKFLHQLVSGQLDMDRLDYLSRDSFFSGVSEGIIGAARIIKMLNLHNDELVVDIKGIYSIEKFLVARRLMYWQVYLHKTSVAAEKMLVNILKRAKELANLGAELFSTPALNFFLHNTIDKKSFLNSNEALMHFVMLDDSDFISAIKVWSSHTDKVLSILCTDFTNRKLFKVDINTAPLNETIYNEYLKKYMLYFGITKHEAMYFLGDEVVTTDTYSPKDDNINILLKDGTVKDVAEISDMLNIQVLTKKVEKYYFCYYKIQ
jgi:HD superfamily phosphohydrolase